MKQPPSATLRMETLNVRSLSGRLGGVLDLANLHALHVMCFQETRVHQDSWSAVCIAAKKSGWDVYPGKQDTDSSGAVVGGTLILSKWPAQPVQVPDTVQCPSHGGETIQAFSAAIAFSQCLFEIWHPHSGWSLLE